MKSTSFIVSVFFSVILIFGFTQCGSSSSSGGGGSTEALNSSQATAVANTFTASAQNINSTASQTPSLTMPMLTAGDVIPQGLTINTSSMEYRSDPNTTGYSSSTFISMVAGGSAPNIKAMYFEGTCDTSGTFTGLIENGDGDNLFTIVGTSIGNVDMDPFKMTYTFTDCVEVCDCGANSYSYEFDGQVIFTASDLDSDPCTARITFTTSNFMLDNASASMNIIYDLTDNTDSCDDLTITCEDHLDPSSTITNPDGSTLEGTEICDQSC